MHEPESTNAPAARQGLAITFRSLRHRNYRLYFFGQMVSVTGYWMQMTALLWLAYDLTGQSRWPALMAAAQSLPTILLSGWGGALADRLPKRLLVLVTQTLFMTLALVVTALVYTDTITAWTLLLCTTVSGIIHAFDLPARLAYVSEMVERDDLMNAVALNSLLFNVARIGGPWLGGLLLSSLGAWPCFLANSLTYLAVLAALGCMECAGSASTTGREGGWRQLLGGFALLREQPRLGILVVLAAAVAFCAWPFLSLLPALARAHLKVTEGGFSALLSGTGVGALSAAFSVATFGSLERRRGFISGGITLILAGLLGLSAAAWLPLAVVCAALIGFGLILFMTTSQSVVQLSVAGHERGRILGIWAMVWGGTPPLGNLLAGPAADLWGEPLVLRMQAAVLGAAALGLLVLWRKSGT